MGTPTTSGGDSSTKSLRVSTEVHERIMAMGDERGWNVDNTIRHLTDDSTLRIPMMPGQRARWEAAAAEAGMPLAVWAVAHVEAALSLGGNAATLGGIRRQLEAIREYFGIGIGDTT